MKKTFKTFALMLLTAFAFSSCVDVPAPFELPNNSKSSGGSSSETAIEPQGDGTIGNPYNIAKLQELINAGQAPTNEIYIKGKISQIKSLDVSKFTRAQYYISDDGNTTNQFYVYNGNYLNGENFTANDQIKVGDVVVILGKLGTYQGSYQVAQGSKIIRLNDTGDVSGEGGEGDATVEPTGDGTKTTPFNVAKVKQLISENKAPEGEIYIKGVVSQIKSLDVSKYSRAQYYISDNGNKDNQFYVYNGLYLDGANFTSNDQIKVGDKVVILGTLGTYQGEYQVAQNSKIISINDNSGDGGQGNGGNQGGNVEHITIAEFLAKADANTTYELTGIVSNITNTTFGNFDLVEGDASIFIYGLLDLDGNKQKFSTLGISEGDEVTLTGKYKLYNNKAEIADAQFISVKKGEGGNGGNDSGNGGNGGGATVTSLVNGGFEDWVDELPTGWKSASSASSSTVSQSTDARNGNYACKVAVPTGTGNARLATQEITLEAGSYTFSYYAKAATAEFAQTKGGHVPVTNGVVGAYTYPKTYTNLSNTEWTFVSYDFELTSTTTVCLLVMNPKTNAQYTAQDILVDDATLVKK